MDVNLVKVIEIENIIYDIGTVVASPLTFNSENGNYQKMVIDVNLTIDAVLHGTDNSCIIYLEVTQEATTGGHTLTLGSNFLTKGGTAIALSTSAGAKDLLVFLTDSAGKYRLIEHYKSFA